MNITNITDDTLISNCTDKDIENDIDIIIPALIFSSISGISFLCILSFMVYSLLKPLFKKK